MLRRLAAMTPWKRRLFALFIGLAIGAAAVLAYLWPQFAGLERLKRDYAAAHRAHDVAALAALFEWDGVPAKERGRLKLSLKEESESDISAVRVEPLRAGDGGPRDTQEGVMVPNLKPVCRLAVTFGGASGAGYAVWLVGRTKDGYRIVVYRPETPAKP